MGDERKLDERRDDESRPQAEEQTDEVGLMLEALREDIQQAKADLDDTIAQAQERARRLDDTGEPPQ